MKRRTRKQLPKLIAASTLLTVCTAGMGVLVMQSIGKQVADEYGCFEADYQQQTAVFVDASEPRWDVTQGRSLQTYFHQLYDELDFNERLSVYTTEGDQVASVVSPRFSVCGQARTPGELVSVNASEAQAGYLKRQKERLFETVLRPQLDQLLSQAPDQSRRQLYESPVMEMILAVSRSAKLESGDRLVVVSDMIQNSESARFCRIKNDMPRFSAFKKRRIYRDRLKPASLSGVGIETLMLMREGYGQGGLQYCSSEEELRNFWRGYFKDNGASDAQFIRIRSGFVGEQ